jgi:hypothetical protein
VFDHSIVLLITVLDCLGAIICLLGALSPRMRLYPKWHTIGLFACIVGLFAQVGINLEFLLADGSSPYAHLGLQPFKDLGIDIIAFTYAGRGILSWLDKDKPASATPVKAKTTVKSAVTKPVTRKPSTRKVTK